jgi:hypothetical protein
MDFTGNFILRNRFLWLGSYIYTARAIFYHEIRVEEASQVIIEAPYEEQTVPPPDIEE